MSDKQLEELKEFTIDINDIDELALGLEVCSKKSNMIIQEFANLIIELEQQCKKQKEVIDKAIELTKNFLKTEDRGYYQIIFKEILKSLGDKENE